MIKNISILKAVAVMSAFTIFGISASLYSVDASGALQANAFEATSQVKEVSVNNAVTEVDFFLKSQDQIFNEKKYLKKVKVRQTDPMELDFENFQNYMEKDLSNDIEIIKQTAPKVK